MAKILNISNQEKKVLTYWGIGLVVIMVIVIILNFFFPMSNVFSELFKRNDKESNKYVLVDDFSRYSTVSAAIEKFYSFQNMKDYDSVLKILDEEYVKENNITKDNIDKYLFITTNPLSYQPNKMYMRKVKGVMTFYVDGKVINQTKGIEYRKQYLKVVLDGNTFHFSIRPIEESEYNEVANG